MKDLTTQQTSGVAHLKDWKVGALFMEAGTGKTRVAVELVRMIEDVDLVVWVAPLRTIKTGGLSGVPEEVEKWGGFACQVVYYGVESISASDRIWLELLDKVKSANKPFVVVDESLKIKNAEAKRTRRLLELGSMVEYKLILNGTPLTRNLLDLWAQMEFLSPKILNMTLQQFKNTFCEYTKVTKRFPNSYRVYEKEYITGYENIDYLHSLIRHYVFQCDLHLNVTQNYKEIRYTISEENMNEYNRLKEKYLDNEMLLWKNNNIFLEMTQKMQHVYACDEGKVAAVEDLFWSIPQEETIIFCKYISSQELCKKLFPKALVLSYQKESFGLNLQKYRHTVYFDKVWDYALRVQSGRRTFRTGQEYDCYYYDVTGDVGLERMIDKNVEKKISMSEYFKKVNIEELRKEL